MPNANRDKGIKAERDLVRYLIAHGAPASVRRSAETGTTQHQDTGDIRGLPGVCIQMKNTPSRAMVDQYLLDCMTEVEDQREAANAAIGVLIEKRNGKASPAGWWLWANLPTINAMCYSECRPAVAADMPPFYRVPLYGVVDDLLLFSATPNRWLYRQPATPAKEVLP
jgi:hypothetical protein